MSLGLVLLEEKLEEKLFMRMHTRSDAIMSADFCFSDYFLDMTSSHQRLSHVFTYVIHN